MQRILLAWVLAGLPLSALAQQPVSPSPSIVLVLADDMGFGDPRCYQPGSKIPTPHLDRLARQGMRFTDAHTPSSVCSPTRYALLTGRYAWRSRLKAGVLVPYDPPLIEAERLTLAKMLAAHGYATACIGKWHLGWHWRRRDGTALEAFQRRGMVKDAEVDLGAPITGGADAAGFAHYFGTDVPNYPPYCFIEDGQIVGVPPDRPKPKDVFGNPGRMQAGWKLERILPELERRAVAYIEERGAQPERPFFLYLPLTAPHTPIVPAAPFQGKSAAGDYGDLVHQVDHVVGAVAAALERSGLAGRTLLIVTSDNGSPARAGDPHLRGKTWAATGAVTRLFEHRPNAPWRGLKSDAWEAGHRVPLIVRWPGVVPAGTINDQLVGLVDWMATIAAIVGHRLPRAAAEDSFDLGATLRDPAQSVRTDLIHHSGNGTFAVRHGRWKLILGLGSGGFSKPARVKPTEGGPTGQLYDLLADPGERENLFAAQPGVVARLSALLERYRAAGRSSEAEAVRVKAP